MRNFQETSVIISCPTGVTLKLTENGYIKKGLGLGSENKFATTVDFTLLHKSKAYRPKIDFDLGAFPVKYDIIGGFAYINPKNNKPTVPAALGVLGREYPNFVNLYFPLKEVDSVEFEVLANCLKQNSNKVAAVIKCQRNEEAMNGGCINSFDSDSNLNGIYLVKDMNSGLAESEYQNKIVTFECSNKSQIVFRGNNIVAGPFVDIYGEEIRLPVWLKDKNLNPLNCKNSLGVNIVDHFRAQAKNIEFFE